MGGDCLPACNRMTWYLGEESCFGFEQPINKTSTLIYMWVRVDKLIEVFNRINLVTAMTNDSHM